MKKVIVALLLISSLNCFCQKDSTRDTVAILSLQQVNEILSYVQIQRSGKADVKPEVWDAIIQALARSVVIRQVPKKEQPNK